jgi:hypothetical protein
MTSEELEYYQKPKLQKLFREKMGEWQVGDWYYSDPFCDIIADIPSANRANKLNHGCLLLPLPIDPRNPERGLWGMVGWGQWDRIESEVGITRVYLRPVIKRDYRLVQAVSPTLALLKALDAQELTIKRQYDITA